MKAKQKTIALATVIFFNLLVSGGIIYNSIYAKSNEIYNNKAVYSPNIVINDLNKKISNNMSSIRIVAYDNLTIDELSAKINKSLNSTLTAKGYLIASYSLELGIDPYLATAIILQETGCKWNCSYLVTTCNNVGGQKGNGCGEYTAYDTIDEGIKKFIENLKINYYDYGLNTVELINSKYAESTTWSNKINNYIEEIKSK